MFSVEGGWNPSCPGRREDLGGTGQIQRVRPEIRIVRGGWERAPRNFEILHALKCVLGACEALHVYLQDAVFDWWFQIEKYDVWGPS